MAGPRSASAGDTSAGSPGDEIGYYTPAYGKHGEPLIEKPDKICGSGALNCEKSDQATGGAMKEQKHWKTCSRCLVFFYCDEECQLRDWTDGFHSQNCVGQPGWDAKLADPSPGDSDWLAVARAEGSLFSDAERRKDCVAVIVQPVPIQRVEEIKKLHDLGFPPHLLRESLRPLREGDLADLGIRQKFAEKYGDSAMEFCSYALWNHFASEFGMEGVAGQGPMIGDGTRLTDDGTESVFFVTQHDNWRAGALPFNSTGSTANLVSDEEDNDKVGGPLFVSKKRYRAGNVVEELEPFALAELIDVMLWRMHCRQRKVAPRRVWAASMREKSNRAVLTAMFNGPDGRGPLILI
jgi:MYND finger